MGGSTWEWLLGQEQQGGKKAGGEEGALPSWNAPTPDHLLELVPCLDDDVLTGVFKE